MKTLIVSLLLAMLGLVRSALGGPIHQAAMAGDIEKVKAILAANPEAIETKGGDTSQTPLHYAVWFGNTALAEFLLTQKADVSSKDAWGMTPLHTAVYRGQLKLLELLFAHKAEVNARDLNNETPLHLATTREIASLLLAHKADVNAKDCHGWTPLALAKKNNRKEVVEVLRQNGGK